MVFAFEFCNFILPGQKCECTLTHTSDNSSIFQRLTMCQPLFSSLDMLTQGRKSSTKQLQFSHAVSTTKAEKSRNLIPRLQNVPVLSKTAGQTDVALTSAHWNVTATLIVLFQLFNLVIQGGSDVDSSVRNGLT